MSPKATSSKSHKAMADSEWMSPLRKFPSTGVWPTGEGNRQSSQEKEVVCPLSDGVSVFNIFTVYSILYTALDRSAILTASVQELTSNEPSQYCLSYEHPQ